MRKNITIAARKNRFKKAIFRFRLRCWAKGFISCIRYDTSLKSIVSTWPDGFAFSIQILSDEPIICFQKDETGLHRSRTNQPACHKAALIFKNLACASDVFSGRLSIGLAFTEENLLLKGSPLFELSLVRAIVLAQKILFPQTIRTESQKRGRRNLNRLKVFTGILLKGKAGKGELTSDPEVLRIFE